MSDLQSRLMVGWVRHRRVLPKPHNFRYPVFMSLIDLDELDSVMAQSRFWSCERFNLISFYRSDYLDKPEHSLKAEVKQKILEKTGNHFSGRICLLTNLRYLGFAFNSVSFYFCYPEQAEQPRYILAEITNTPWNERHCYLLDTQTSSQQSHWSFEFDKAFHVSPYMPMDVHYHWRFKLHPRSITIHMALEQGQQHCFDATLCLRPRPLNPKTMLTIPRATSKACHF